MVVSPPGSSPICFLVVFFSNTLGASSLCSRVLKDGFYRKISDFDFTDFCTRLSPFLPRVFSSQMPRTVASRLAGESSPLSSTFTPWYLSCRDPFVYKQIEQVPSSKNSARGVARSTAHAEDFRGLRLWTPWNNFRGSRVRTPGNFQGVRLDPLDFSRM